MEEKILKIQLVQLWCALVDTSIKSAVQDKRLPLHHCAYFFEALTGLRITVLKDFIPGFTIPAGYSATTEAKERLEDLNDEEKLLLAAALSVFFQKNFPKGAWTQWKKKPHIWDVPWWEVCIHSTLIFITASAILTLIKQSLFIGF